jgi:hypothetical protein
LQRQTGGREELVKMNRSNSKLFCNLDMSIKSSTQRSGRRIQIVSACALRVAALCMILQSRAHSQTSQGNSPATGGFSPTEATSLITGPVSILLSNSVGFSTRVTAFQTSTASKKSPALTGGLVAQQGRFLWTPGTPKAHAKASADQGFSLIWDAGQGCGYVLSEVLQGYAPVTALQRFTNVIRAPDPESTPSEKLDGRRCRPERVTVLSNDGMSHRFQTWGAVDLNGLPLKMVAASDNPGATVLLSQVRIVKPPPAMFEPPSGFTRYDSAEAMANEILLRQQNLQRRPEGENPRHGTPDQPTPRPGHPAAGSY